MLAAFRVDAVHLTVVCAPVEAFIAIDAIIDSCRRCVQLYVDKRGIGEP